MYRVEISILREDNSIETYQYMIDAENERDARKKALNQIDASNEDLINIKIKKTA